MTRSPSLAPTVQQTGSPQRFRVHSLILLLLVVSVTGHAQQDTQQADQPKANESNHHSTHSPQLLIELTVLADNRWKLLLESDEDVSSICFLPGYPNLPWTVSAEEFELVTQDEMLQAKRRDGKLFRKVELEVVPQFRETIRDYEPIWKFSDGAFMVFSGQFPREVILESGKLQEVTRSFAFASERDENLVLDGAVHELPNPQTRIDWAPDDRDRDTYVYFGSGSIVETDVYVGLLDPALPKWIEKKFKVLAPQLTEYFTQRIGAPLPFRPMIMFSFDGQVEDRRNYTGGTLPGLVQLNLTGSGWFDDRQDAHQQFAHFLAHELAHLWNSKLIRPAKKTPAWIHEGTSELMAFNSLLHFEIIDRHDYRKRLQEAIDRFIENSQGIALNDSMEHGQSKNFYDGGILIGLMVQQAAISKDPNHDYLAFWKYFTKQVLDSERRYTAEDYVRAVKEFVEHEELNLWTTEFPKRILDDPAKIVDEMFQPLGLGQRRDDKVLIDPIVPRIVEGNR